MNQKLIVGLGELLYDCKGSGRQLLLGGAAANATAVAAQLGEPSQFAGYIISRVGSDYLGASARRALEARNVDCQGIQVDGSLPTGVVDVFEKEGSEQYHIPSNVAYDRIDSDATARRIMRSAHAVIYGCLALRTEANRRSYDLLFRELSRTTERICDINLRKDCYSRSSVDWCLAHASTFKLNEGEVKDLRKLGLNLPLDLREFAQEILVQFPNITTCIVTRGRDGLLVSTRDGLEEVPGVALSKGEQADTIGCGDAVSGAYAVRLLEQVHPIHAVAYANFAGAFAATQQGGIYPLSRKILDEFVANHRALSKAVFHQNDILRHGATHDLTP